jgi:hypothetical protein
MTGGVTRCDNLFRLWRFHVGFCFFAMPKRRQPLSLYLRGFFDCLKRWLGAAGACVYLRIIWDDPRPPYTLCALDTTLDKKRL